MMPTSGPWRTRACLLELTPTEHDTGTAGLWVLNMSTCCNTFDMSCGVFSRTKVWLQGNVEQEAIPTSGIEGVETLTAAEKSEVLQNADDLAAASTVVRRSQ